MSENREVIEKKEIDESEKIDIMNLVTDLLNAVRKLWGLLIVLLIVCTLRSYFATSFSYTPQYEAKNMRWTEDTRISSPRRIWRRSSPIF